MVFSMVYRLLLVVYRCLLGFIGVLKGLYVFLFIFNHLVLSGL